MYGFLVKTFQFHGRKVNAGKLSNTKGTKVIADMLTVDQVPLMRAYKIKKNFRYKLTHLLQVFNHEIRLIGTFPREPN